MIQPSGVISLTTDFGLEDPFVGCVKAVIAARAPGLRVIDLTHGVRPQAIDEASFWLARAYRYFPSGTVHVAVVDPGVGSARRLLACAADGHLFLAPDNGLLAPFLGLEGAEVRSVSSQTIAAYGLQPPSNTFHGRDIFAPLAAVLASGKLLVSDTGPQCRDPVPGNLDVPVMAPGQVQGRVVAADRFGNLLTNIDAAMLGDWRELVVLVNGLEVDFVRTYAEAEEGALVALVNAFGVVELARRNGRASGTDGLDRGALVRVCRVGG